MTTTCRRVQLPSAVRTGRRVVLDLDQTLVYTFDPIGVDYLNDLIDNPSMSDVKKRLYSISLSDGYMWGLERNHLGSFLDFLDVYCDGVDVWSAGSYDYVHAIVDRIFEGRQRRPDNIWTRRDCIMVGGDYVKPLMKIWSKERRPENTLFIDDNPHYMMMNDGNAVIIPPYDPIKNGHCDYELPKLMNWLSEGEIIGSRDVRYLEKDKIFQG